LRKYHEKTRAKNTRERTSRVRSAHERARILTSLFLSSSCENRVQTIGTGQSPFSPALSKYGSFAKISREDESEKHERKNVESSLRSREG